MLRGPGPNRIFFFIVLLFRGIFFCLTRNGETVIISEFLPSWIKLSNTLCVQYLSPTLVGTVQVFCCLNSMEVNSLFDPMIVQYNLAKFMLDKYLWKAYV